MRSVLSNRARALLTAVVVLAALGLPVAASAVPAATASVAASSRPAAAVRVPHYDHIAVIMDTSHDYGSILHNKFAPNINRLAHQYGLASHYFTVTDPDTANLMALLAGDSFGIGNGVPYWDTQLHKSSLLSQLTSAHKSWKEYSQGLPYPGYLGACYPTRCLQTDTLYNQTQFNSVADLASVVDNPAQARSMVPATELAADARTGRLPTFSLINADECRIMHGGPPWCEDSSNSYHQADDNKLVSAGDSHIGQVVREIMSGKQWRHGNNAIVVTFTEGDTTQGCCDVKAGTGHVITIVITSHGPRHLVDPVPFNHYSLLRTIQDALGLPCLRHSCDKVLVPMAKLFGAASDAAARPAGAVGTGLAAPKVAAPAVLRPAVPSSWALVTSPNVGPSDNQLTAVAGGSASDIWAVGSMLPNANATRLSTLALHYNGVTWSRVATPNTGSEANSFYGVAALPDGTAWATGIYTTSSGHTGRALIEHWNGHHWTLVPAADPGSADDMLYGVTAVSDTNVWAVGGYSGPDGFFHPLIERWNGHHWAVRTVKGLRGDRGMLTSVTSSPVSGVWATGQLVNHAPDQQVVLHLVGGSWVVARGAVRTPAGAVASADPQSIGISPLGPWVAGNDRAGHAGFSTLVEAPGSGGHLAQQKTPNPTPQDNYLSGISPVNGGNNAWAVGYSQSVATGNASSLIEYGSAVGGWKIVSSPDPGAVNSGNTFINGVLRLADNNVWAVGTYDGVNSQRTLILHYTGGPI
ncbi:MAG TPA: alkaline phosphatase family protein [Streptosporangiaceae bacterium]